MRKIAAITMIMLVAFTVSSCGVRKYVPEGKALLLKNKVEINAEDSDISKSSVKKHITQKELASLFGWLPGVNIYYTTVDKKDKKFYKWVNEHLGTVPVYYDETSTAESRREIVTYLNNIGFFKSKVESSYEVKKVRAKVTYKITPSKPYIIRNIGYDIKDSLVYEEIKKIETSLPVKVGNNYNAFDMDDERDVIVEHLRNSGYYYFTKDQIIFEVDTNFNERRADVTLYIGGKKYDKYLIDNVFIYPNYKIDNTLPYDTTDYVFSFGKKNQPLSFDFVCSGDPRINFKTFNQVIQMHPGDYFCQKKISQTYSALGKLKVYSWSNIRFDTVASSPDDSVRHLNCDVYLQKGKLNSYNIQLEGTNSAGNFGALGSVTYKNNNIFRGSEVFSVKLKGGYQFVSTDKEVSSSGRFHSREFGADVSITFPRFLGPFNMHHFVQEYQPKTTLTLGYDSRTRPLYKRQTAVATFGYNWMTTNTMQHILTPINLNTVKVDQTDYFKKLLAQEQNQRVKDQYTSHLIFGLNYSFIFNNQNRKVSTDFFYVKADIETSGNLLSLFNRTGIMSEVNDYHEILGIRYAQYVKLGIDFRFFHYFNYGSLAIRAMGGYGIPYGNSNDMPFEKSYYAGGANGMRGWGFRRLGPGGYQTDNKSVERIGNIQMEFNFEYRFPIYNFLNGALFTDIGNIWNSRPIESFPNSEFKFDTFYKQLAMDLGIGLRLDFSFFLIRFDFAIPYRDPAFDEGQRWRFSKWQWKDVAFNFGIGYPF